MEEKQNIIELTEAETLAALRIVLKRQRRMHWDAQAKAPIKSDAFRQLEKAGKLNAEFFLEEAGRIMARTSTLSSGQRAYVSAIMDEAAKEAVDARSRAAEEKAAAAPAKPARKPGASKTGKTTTANKKPAKSNKTAAKSNKTATKSNK